MRWSLAGPSLRDLHIFFFFYRPLNKTFLGGSERLSPLPPSAGAAAAAREGEGDGDVAPAPAAGWLRAQPCPARSRCPAALLPCAGRSFFSVVSEFTGFRAADLGAGPVPLHAQEEPRRQRCCRRLHKPAHFFFLILFFCQNFQHVPPLVYNLVACKEAVQGGERMGKLAKSAMERESVSESITKGAGGLAPVASSCCLFVPTP